MEDHEDRCTECEKVVWFWQRKIWIDGIIYHRRHAPNPQDALLKPKDEKWLKDTLREFYNIMEEGADGDEAVLRTIRKKRRKYRILKPKEKE